MYLDLFIYIYVYYTCIIMYIIWNRCFYSDGRYFDLEASPEVGDYVKSFDSFQDLHQEIVATDSLLEKMLGRCDEELA